MTYLTGLGGPGVDDSTVRSDTARCLGQTPCSRTSSPWEWHRQLQDLLCSGSLSEYDQDLTDTGGGREKSCNGGRLVEKIQHYKAGKACLLTQRL